MKLIRALQDDAIRRRREKVYDATSMAVTARLLEINPDVAVAWNFRRECIRCLGYAEDAGTGAGGAEDGADTAVGRSQQPVGEGETS